MMRWSGAMLLVCLLVASIMCAQTIPEDPAFTQQSVLEIETVEVANSQEECVTDTSGEKHPAPDIHEVILEGMPIFYQINSEFDGRGETFCVPTSASSNLMWLAAHGYPALIEKEWNNKDAQKEMVKELAYFMATKKRDKFGTSGGTDFERFRIGIDRYLIEHGYEKGTWKATTPYTSNGYQGPPDPKLFLSLGPKTMIWATLGRYQYDVQKNLFTRDPIGHQVSLHGVGIDAQGNLAYLVIADPAFQYRFKTVHLKALPVGKLRSKQAKVPTEGYFELKELSQIWGDWRDKRAILETIKVMTLN